MIKPKLKKDNLDSKDYPNFRPISNLKVVSKIIEKVIHDQTQNFLDGNNIMYKYQSGFRRFFFQPILVYLT